MENQILAVAYSKIKEDDKFSFYLPKEFAEIVTEIIISFDPSFHKTIKYPKSLAGLPTRIINKNNLKDESYADFRKSEVIFISYYLDSYLADILKELPNVEGYYLSPDDWHSLLPEDRHHLIKMKNKMFFFDIVEKLQKEIIVGNFTSDSSMMFCPIEDEWIINDRVEKRNIKYFATAKILEVHYQGQFTHDAFLSQLEHKMKLIFENIKCYYPHIYSIIENNIRDKKKSKTVFVVDYFNLVPKIIQSKIESLIKQSKRPHQKFIFSFFGNENHTFKYLFPVQIKFPTDSEFISDYTPSEVFKLLISLFSRKFGKDTWLREIPGSLTDSIIKNLDLFQYGLSGIYTILCDLFKEQDSIHIDYLIIDFWYEIYFRLNEAYPLIGEYDYQEKLIKDFIHTDSQTSEPSAKEERKKRLSTLPDQLRFELKVIEKQNSNEKIKKWIVLYNGKKIKKPEYEKKIIHTIKILYENYLNGITIGAEELSKKIDDKLVIDRKERNKEKEKGKIVDSHQLVLNRLRQRNGSFFDNELKIDLKKHFKFLTQECFFDPHEKLGISFLEDE